MSGALRCESCNAAFEFGATHCEHCGSPVGAPAVVVHEPAVPSTRRVLEEIDAQIRAGTVQPDAELEHVERPIFAYVFGVLLIAGPLAMGLVAMKMGAGVLFLVVPAIFACIGIAIIVGSHVGFSRRRAARPEPHAASILSRRIEVIGGNDSTRTGYHVTLEFADGRRAEHDVEGAFYGTVAEGDVGVAWTRADWLQAFDRRDV